MFGFLFGKILTHPTIKAKNLVHRYLTNADLLSRSMGEKLLITKDALKPRLAKVYVLDFDGDASASGAEGFGEEITSILSIAKPEIDSVLIRINSPGGHAHAYGYAASQIERLKNAKLRVVVAVDRIAASGGYMMACVADEIIAAPYAIVGSIGVAAEFPNFSRLLKELGVDYKQYTAGKFKRTISTFGEISEEAEGEFLKGLVDMHEQFKSHVLRFRTKVDVDVISSGKTWNGQRALELGLIDRVLTSEEFIFESIETCDVIKIEYIGEKPSFGKKLSAGFAEAMSSAIVSALTKIVVNFGYKW